jgi:hypothetical protein
MWRFSDPQGIAFLVVVAALVLARNIIFTR